MSLNAITPDKKVEVRPQVIFAVRSALCPRSISLILPDTFRSDWSDGVLCTGFMVRIQFASFFQYAINALAFESWLHFCLDPVGMLAAPFPPTLNRDQSHGIAQPKILTAQPPSPALSVSIPLTTGAVADGVAAGP